MKIDISPTLHRVPPITALSPHLTWGTTVFPPDAFLVLHIGATGRQVVAPRKQEILIGRIAEGTQHLPDIDLAPYEAVEYGVSRLHAVLTASHTRVTVTDLGSSNGTWLKDVKLEPHRPSVIREGDDLKFGTLLTYVYFLQMDRDASN